MNGTHAASVRLFAWRHAVPEGARPISRAAAGRLAGVSGVAWRDWETKGAVADARKAVAVERATGGAVKPADWCRDPQPEDSDLSADVSRHRKAAREAA